MERKIADNQDLAPHVPHTEIHFVLLIRENPQIHQFVGHKFGILIAVAFADAQINKQDPLAT